MTARSIAVVGGGWAGLAAAVRAVQAGHRVTLLEMAQHLGGRARSVPLPGAGAGPPLDNGQHILIGAYRRTLDLLRTVGGQEAELLCRSPLELRYADGRGLALPDSRWVPSWMAFVHAAAGCVGWSWSDRAALIRTAAGWALDRFRCDPALTVDALCRALPPAVRELLIDPLCVAALNTPAREASAQVMLRVLRDALFGGRGAADLLLPRRALGELLPEPAARWLSGHGAFVRTGQRVAALVPAGDPDDAGGAGTTRTIGWRIGNDTFDGVVLAVPPTEAARLTATLAPAWSARAQALRYEPIATVYLECPGARLPAPMTALIESGSAPAQFAFDHGALGGATGRFVFVVSGAAPWVERGTGALAAAVLDQARTALPAGTWPTTPRLLKVLVERRATFRCTPALDRPPAEIAPRLVAAGDYVAGPYPATLEGSVRAGEAAVRSLA
ncbi:MAG: FAD-dependent oxidoreductase [Burkholderiales bacterium]|nr:FAD-dependent oxidoreductase [Burkholderiales bacterium]